MISEKQLIPLNNYPKSGEKKVNIGKFLPLDAEIKDSMGWEKNTAALQSIGKSALTEYVYANGKDSEETLKEFGVNVPSVLKEGVDSRSLALKLAREGGDFYENSLKEELTTTNTQSYTTFLEQMIRGDFLAEIDRIMSLAFKNEDLMKSKGSNSMYFSIGEPTTAAVYGEGGDIVYFAEGVSRITVVPIKIASGTRITWETSKYNQPDFMKFNLRRISHALQRYVAKYILTIFASGSGHSAVTGGVDYDALVDARKLIISATTTGGVEYGFMPDKLVMSPDGAAKFYKDSLIKQYVYFSAIMNAKGTDMARPVIYFFGMEVIETPYLNVTVGGKAVEAMLVDSSVAGMFVKASDVEVFEGRLPRAVDREIIMAMLMNVVVLFSKAIAIVVAP